MPVTCSPYSGRVTGRYELGLDAALRVATDYLNQGRPIQILRLELHGRCSMDVLAAALAHYESERLIRQWHGGRA